MFQTSIETASRNLALHVPKKNKCMFSESFFQDFKKLLEKLVTFRCPIAVVGDFNITWKIPKTLTLSSLMSYLQSFGLQQHVSSPTHNRGGILDVIHYQIRINPLQKSLFMLHPSLIIL